MRPLTAAAVKIGGPERVSPGQFSLKDEARKARGRLMPTTVTFLAFSVVVIGIALREGPAPRVIGFAFGGVLFFSFVEYAVHRFILHGRFPDGPGVRHTLHKAFDHLHIQHHARPWDSNHNGGTLNDTLLPILAIFALFVLATPFSTGPVFWAAIAFSYVAEEWIHHALHYGSFRHPAFLALRRHHSLHHALPGTESNYGLSSPLWDILLGTRFKAAVPSTGKPATGGRLEAALVLAATLLTTAEARADDASGRCLSIAPGECVQVTLSGAGPDVVLVPGLFGSAFAFRQLIPRLSAEGYRSIVVEPLGVGDSARPSRADYSLSAQAVRIGKALDLLGVGEAILVSHSIGTSMTLRLAAQDTHRIRAVVSMDGGGIEEAGTPGFRRAMKLAPLLKLFGAGRLIRGRVRGMLASRSGDPRWVTDEVVARYSEGALRDPGATLDAYRQMANAREPEPLAPRLREVRCPVRLILGAAVHEGRPTEAEIEILRSNLRSFTLSHVPGAGSFLFEEAPDAVVAAVNEVGGAAHVRTAGK